MVHVCSIDNRTKGVVAIKIIDLEAADDEIEDIQQEMTVLAQVRRCRLGNCPSIVLTAPPLQCDSPYVTRYFGSYLKGSHLWIIQEFLGGGSALDLVRCHTC